MKKRLLSLLLAGVMILGIASCGSKETATEEPKSETTAAETVTEEPKAEEKAPEPEVKEPPTKITIASNAAMQTDPVQWYETDVYKKIWEMANVEVEYIQLDDETFNVMLASGDMPDIIAGKGNSVANNLDSIIASGLALDMAPLMESLAPNMLQEQFVARNEIVMEYKGGENKALYFICPDMGYESARGAQESSRGYCVRWDWYKEIGAPEINSDADYIAAIEQMVANHPTTANGEKVYGIGVYDNFSQWYMRGTFAQPAMTNPWTSGHLYMAKFDGSELINGYTNVEEGAYWVDMRFYNALYNKGLLDPDSFTQKSDAFTTKVKAERYAAVGSRNTNLYNTTKKSDPDTLAGFIRIPSSNAITYRNKKAVTGNFPTEFIFINAKTKNVEACMRVMNVLHDFDTIRMMWSGFEGEHWEYVNGEARLTDAMVALKADTSSDELKRKGIYLDLLFGATQRSFIHPDGYPVDLSDTDEMRASTLNPFWEDYCEYYGVSYPSQAATKLVDEGKTIDMSKDSAQLILTTIPSFPTDVSRIMEKCDDIMYRAIPDLVMAPNEEAFQKVQAQVLKDLEAIGEAQAWEWFSGEYNKSKAVVDPIFNSTSW